MSEKGKSIVSSSWWYATAYIFWSDVQQVVKSLTVHPLHSRCIKQLLRHGSELWTVASSTRVYTQLLQQPSRSQLHASLQPPHGIRIWHTAAAGLWRHNASDLCKIKTPLLTCCICKCTIIPLSLKSHPAFLLAGVPYASCRSQSGFFVVPSGSQSGRTAELWFIDGCHQAGRG